MKKSLASLVSIAICVVCSITFFSTATFAAERKVVVSGAVYELAKDAGYNLTEVNKVNESASRIYITGNVSNTATKNGFTSYAVKDGKLKVFVDTSFLSEQASTDSKNMWHVIPDKTKVVDSNKLAGNIETGAIIVQTSKDGKVWITAESKTDFYRHPDTINTGGPDMNSFYETTNVQLSNGCFYRIIVAYKLQREIDPTRIAFISIPKTEEKEQLEIYEFYAYDPSVNKEEVVDQNSAYEFSNVVRTAEYDGYFGESIIKSDDPHNGWKIGEFYVSGYTQDIDENGTPVFLKVPGDKAALWFKLNYDLDKCNNNTAIRVTADTAGSDRYFGTGTMNFGRGTLIVRKTTGGHSEDQIYTNYLEASATAGANTRVDLFEEGNYEVALDYQLEYNNTVIFNQSILPKTLHYRVYFKFKVRNGDISFFLRDAKTGQFITNANVAEHGFKIDVAQSKYLSIAMTREVMSESMDGLVPDTKFTGVAKEGRVYSEEGVYTVTVKNPATGASTTKKVYVGDSDVIKAHMHTGLPIQTINERVAAGASIDPSGNIIDPVVVSLDSTSDEVQELPKETDDFPGPTEDPIQNTVTTANTIVKAETAENASIPEDSVGGPASKAFPFNVIAIGVVILASGAAMVSVIFRKASAHRRGKEDESA